jgi:hypothetical protein
MKIKYYIFCDIFGKLIAGEGGAKSVPSTDGGSSDGSTIKVSFNFVLSLVAIVFCVVTKF